MFLQIDFMPFRHSCQGVRDMKKIIALILAAFTLIMPLTAYAGEEKMENIRERGYYDKIIEKETKAIAKCAFSNGAIAMYAPSVSSYSSYSMPVVDGISPDEYTTWRSGKVMPYFSDTAVFGLIQTAKVTGSSNGKDVCLNYINWYISHMNTKESDISGVKGTVYDYFIFESNDGRIVEVTTFDANKAKYPTGNPYDYDSTDSYASLFLQILYEYTNVYDNTFLDDKKEVVDDLVGVIQATYVKGIDLTYAKPTYAICYMMDNCEVYCGYESAEKIYREYLDDDKSADQCRLYADKVKSAITGRMWDESKQMFLPNVDTKGKLSGTVDLGTFYPDGSCQLFPVIFGVIKSNDTKAISTYKRFKENFCQSGVVGKDWSVYDLKSDHYPWCILVRAVIAMKDYETADRFINTAYKKFVLSTHGDPFYCAESGHLLLAVCELYPLSVPEVTEESAEESVEVSEESEEASDVSDVIGTVSEENKDEAKKSPIVPILIAAGAAAVIAAAVVIAVKKHGKKS